MSLENNLAGSWQESTVKLGPVIRTQKDLDALAKRFDTSPVNSEPSSPEVLDSQKQNPFKSMSYAELQDALRKHRNELREASQEVKEGLGESINNITDELSNRSATERVESRASEEAVVRRNAQTLPPYMLKAQLDNYREAQRIFSTNPYNSPDENQANFDEFAWKIAVIEEEISRRPKEEKSLPEEGAAPAKSSGLKGFMGKIFGSK